MNFDDGEESATSESEDEAHERRRRRVICVHYTAMFMHAWVPLAKTAALVYFGVQLNGIAYESAKVKNAAEYLDQISYTRRSGSGNGRIVNVNELIVVNMVLIGISALIHYIVALSWFF